MINLSKFGERLKELMNDKNINAPALAKSVGTDRTNITRYMRGERLPQFNTFAAVIEFFGCSADYLLGLTEYQKDGKHYLDVKPFDVSLKKTFECTGKSQYGLAKQQKISASLIYDWLTGKRLPSMENLIKLGDYFEVSLDYLLGREV